jgi:hypothetical protein
VDDAIEAVQQRTVGGVEDIIQGMDVMDLLRVLCFAKICDE